MSTGEQDMNAGRVGQFGKQQEEMEARRQARLEGGAYVPPVPEAAPSVAPSAAYSEPASGRPMADALAGVTGGPQEKSTSEVGAFPKASYVVGGQSSSVPLYIGIAGALLVAIGDFLPQTGISSSYGSDDVFGIWTNNVLRGTIVLVLALVTAGLLAGRKPVGALVAGILTILMVANEFRDALSFVLEPRTDLDTALYLGWGWFVLGLGLVGIIVGARYLLVHRDEL